MVSTVVDLIKEGTSVHDNERRNLNSHGPVAAPSTSTNLAFSQRHVFLLYGNKRQNIGSTAAAPFDKEEAINKNRQADHKTMSLFFDVSKMYTIDRDQTPNSI